MLQNIYAYIYAQLFLNFLYTLKLPNNEYNLN